MNDISGNWIPNEEDGNEQLVEGDERVHVVAVRIEPVLGRTKVARWYTAVDGVADVVVVR